LRFTVEKYQSEEQLDIRGNCGRDITGIAGGPARSLKFVRKLSIAAGGTRLSVRPFHEQAATSETLRRGLVEPWESDMMSEMQIHTIARQMMEKHGLTAIAQAAHNAQACESKGDAEEATEWRHIEDAMKMMRGPHQS
jgi:hypothetical protein